jgi:hypothetical protein
MKSVSKRNPASGQAGAVVTASVTLGSRSKAGILAIGAEPHASSAAGSTKQPTTVAEIAGGAGPNLSHLGADLFHLVVAAGSSGAGDLTASQSPRLTYPAFAQEIASMTAVPPGAGLHALSARPTLTPPLLAGGLP